MESNYRLAPGILAFFLMLSLTACEQSKQPLTSESNPTRPAFIDYTDSSRLSFRYDSGASGKLFMAEIIGGGVAMVDCDNDGDLDLFFPQGSQLDALNHRADAQPRLFRNTLIQGRLEFVDITKHSGIGPGNYGMGAAAGDVNRDGLVDLYITAFGRNRLLLNQGDCQFSETDSGVQDNRWGVSAAFVDYDRDGWLDLFVGNYVDHQLAYNASCTDSGGARDYCGPKTYLPQKNRLFHNNADGTFTDTTTLAGIDSEYGGALGVIAADLDGDGWQDIYVANDQRPNLLWRNQQNGQFENIALLAGCAVNSAGLAEASMGVDLGDVNQDGVMDLFMSHLRQESNTLYLMNNGQCVDRSSRTELASPSLSFTGFGTGFIDFDNDGDLDIFVANGEVEIIAEQAQSGDPFPLRQRNQLFENEGNGSFRELTVAELPILSHRAVSRGVGFGDLDNDGDTDLVVINSGENAQVLLNQSGHQQNWHGLIIKHNDSGSYAIGATVTAILDDGTRLIRRVSRDGSYASSNDPRVRFGLGRDRQISQFQVNWPDGRITPIKASGTNQYQTVIRQREND